MKSTMLYSSVSDNYERTETKAWSLCCHDMLWNHSYYSLAKASNNIRFSLNEGEFKLT